MRHLVGKLLTIAMAASLLASLPIKVSGRGVASVSYNLFQTEGLSREDICHNCQRVLGFVYDHYKHQTTKKSIQHKIRHLCNRYFDVRSQDHLSVDLLHSRISVPTALHPLYTQTSGRHLRGLGAPCP